MQTLNSTPAPICLVNALSQATSVLASNTLKRYYNVISKNCNVFFCDK